VLRRPSEPAAATRKVGSSTELSSYVPKLPDGTKFLSITKDSVDSLQLVSLRSESNEELKLKGSQIVELGESIHYRVLKRFDRPAFIECLEDAERQPASPIRNRVRSARHVFDSWKCRSIFGAAGGVSFRWIRRVKRSLNNDLDLTPSRALQAGGQGFEAPRVHRNFTPLLSPI
jgi:hypothetical protein